ncbi:MAG: hydrogenase maturation protease [Burkholderiaceae bacterium]|nr:hydrogenase maturation protease [Burkholderiaceae bacterium]
MLVLAVGNPSRGDDALAPVLLERLAVVVDPAEVELLTDFQLQVEHALDLAGRRAVLFVDATLPGLVRGATLEALQPDLRVPPASHALRPQAVLRVALDLQAQLPSAWLLAIEGRRFELGEGLSEAASQHLLQAMALARGWLRAWCTAQAEHA